MVVSRGYVIALPEERRSELVGQVGELALKAITPTSDKVSGHVCDARVPVPPARVMRAHPTSRRMAPEPIRSRGPPPLIS